jgi:hypothetical protein
VRLAVYGVAPAGANDIRYGAAGASGAAGGMKIVER